MKAKDGDKGRHPAFLTIGPLLFHWPEDKRRDFYFRIADEAPVDTVYLGEVVCSKRAPFIEHHYPEIVERLKKGGKKVVFSSLAELMLPRERKATQGLCETEEFEVEANDACALHFLHGKQHRIGQYFNVYNEDTLEYLAGKGATHFSLTCELPATALDVLGEKAESLGVELEVQVYGRVGLALSARCYHARSYGRIKDNCQFVCENDADGMVLKTLDGQDFLAVNGIQTLSYGCLSLLREMNVMRDKGIHYFRLSPHSQDMVKVSEIFCKVLDGKTSAVDGENQLLACNPPGPFFNGFYYGKQGYKKVS